MLRPRLCCPGGACASAQGARTSRRVGSPSVAVATRDVTTTITTLLLHAFWLQIEKERKEELERRIAEHTGATEVCALLPPRQSGRISLAARCIVSSIPLILSLAALGPQERMAAELEASATSGRAPI